MKIRITIKTPDQFKDGLFRISNGAGSKKFNVEKLTYWLDKALRRAIVATGFETKKPAIAVRVDYGGGMRNETLDSLDYAYLYNTTLIFLENYISRKVINKTKNYKWQ